MGNNIGRCWDAQQKAWLRETARKSPNVSVAAWVMGRTEAGIVAQMHKQLGYPLITSNEHVLQLYKARIHEQDNSMKDDIKPNASPSKYRLVSTGYVDVSADSMEEAETTARALIQKNPTREIFILQAVKRCFSPANVAIEDIE